MRLFIRLIILAAMACAVLGARDVAFARGGGGCLDEGTPVLTPSGPVAIEQLHEGDEVVSAIGPPLKIGRVIARMRVVPEHFVEIEFPSGSLRATDEHPLATAEGEFRMAGHLREGDELLIFSSDDGELRREEISRIRRTPASRPASNLLIDEEGTFIAGGVLVHNKGCFLPDTPILKADGSESAISALVPGDRVLAFREDGSPTQTTVQEILTREAPGTIEIVLEHTVVRATAEHPFYVGDGTFRTLSSLKAGDTVFAFDGRGISPQRILALREIDGPVTVYNLQVDAPHTFFAAGIAVHNKGGGSHGGRHSHRSRGGSSGKGGNSPVPFFLALTFIILVVILKGRKGSKGGDLDHLYSASEVAAKAKKTKALIDFIARQDAALTPAAIEERARTTFVKLQACWQARDYGPMKPLLMSDLYEEHCGQLRGMERNHEINVIEGLVVERIDLVHLRYTHKPEEREFTALITARARDYYTDDRTGKVLRGDDAAATFQEFWTFQLCSGGWLLREIEQTAESDILDEENFFEAFTDTQLAAIYGGAVEKLGAAGPWLEKDVQGKETKISRLLNFLAETDPLWRQQEMKERVRQVFARVHLALEAGEAPSGLAKDLSPDALADFQATLARMREGGQSIELRNLCVRKVELILIRNRDARSEDEFVARIRAHAQRIAKRRGAVLHQDEDVTAFEEFWTFGRYDGAWKLKEKLPPGDGRSLVGKENVEEEMGPDMLTWFYSKKRTV